ncbi:unnamed protein product [Tenebrio molitor]|nr:unnamed protein product [Tenebrio molitor]
MLHDHIRISAGGFFTVDMHLFFSIISACVTYLVVVWQFLHFTDQNCF